MTVDEKKELVAFLKHGDKKKICELAGVHETVMYGWISDRLKNSSIEPYVIQFANMRKKELETQTGETLQGNLIGNEVIIRENLQLKTELKQKQKEIQKFMNLIAAKNRLSRELFSTLKNHLDDSNLPAKQKHSLLEKIEYFQADYTFLNHYEKYADILNTINPLLAAMLDELNADFSNSEKQLLYMLKLHLSNHEIALILAVSEDFIHQKNKLLKRKLRLKQGQDLPDYINSL